MSIETKKVKARKLINGIKKLDTKEKYLGFILALTVQIDFSKGECSTNLERQTIISCMLQATIAVGNYGAAAASAADQVEEMYNGLFEMLDREAHDPMHPIEVIMRAIEAAEKAARKAPKRNKHF